MAAARQLRRQFGVGDGDFLVVLVDKDGGTKRIAAEPPPLVELIAQIDAMPMRRAEAARQRIED